MSCKSDVQFNFAQASTHDDLVYGAARPGAASQRCFNAEDKVTPEEVEQWAYFMQQHGIKRVVSLLTPSELETYVEPPSATLQKSFVRVTNVDPKAPGAADAIVKELTGAVEAHEKVVVHCWGGGGRTGQALAAWLMRHYGLSAEQAGAEVEAHAKELGASRRVELPLLHKLLGTDQAA